jgi:hypothetical protein
MSFDFISTHQTAIDALDLSRTGIFGNVYFGTDSKNLYFCDSQKRMIPFDLLLAGTYLGASVLSGLADVLLSNPLDGQVLTYDGASGRWKNKPQSGGGGGAPAGSNITYLPWLVGGGFSNPTNGGGTWGGYTLFTAIEGNRVMNAGSKCKIDLFVPSGGSLPLKVNKAVLQKWNRDFPSYGGFISSVPITWNGGNASPTFANQHNLSDEIEMAVDPSATYQIVIYFDSSSSSSASLQSVYVTAFGPQGSGNVPAQAVYSGDWTGFTSYGIAIGQSSGFYGNGQWQFCGLNQFVTA